MIKTEKWITVEMGDGGRRNMPYDKWAEAKENSKWLIETALKAGWSKKRAEEEFSVRIVDEYECEVDC